MKILIDSREQRPLKFKCPTARQKLDVGDYMAEMPDGSVVPVAFDRKALGDLFGTLSQGYARFKRSMARAKAADVRLILIVEGTLEDVARGYYKSTRSGSSIVKQIFSLQCAHDLTTVFCQDRIEMRKYIEAFFYAYKVLKERK